MLQVTAVFELPVTVAVYCTGVPIVTAAAPVTATETSLAAREVVPPAPVPPVPEPAGVPRVEAEAAVPLAMSMPLPHPPRISRLQKKEKVRRFKRESIGNLRKGGSVVQ
jgi:hypothetical protein